MPRSTVISAPGKVLITGGYLVLDPAYQGTVISTSSRFYTVISNSPIVKKREVVVTSPQFLDAQWEYHVQFPQDNSGMPIRVTPSPHGTAGDNRFVHLALNETMKLAQSIVGMQGIANALTEDGEEMGLSIVIVGDNDFYSQRRNLHARGLPLTLESLAKLDPFCSLGIDIGSVHKTGLGSSAALITSLVSALLVHFGGIPSSTIGPSITGPLPFIEHENTLVNELAIVHNVAQYTHCLAQGKVGSGFDVSSAMYGSQVYQRFDSDVLLPLMQQSGDTTLDSLLEVLQPSDSWTNKVNPISLPPHLRLLLADVDAGSDTPSLVGRVLSWRKSNPAEAKQVWDDISQLNRQVAIEINTLRELAHQDLQAYEFGLLEYFAGKEVHVSLQAPGIHDQTRSTLQQLKSTLLGVRKQMKHMGDLADVPIEPDEQTELLDKCLTIAGVIGGGVPGAGGYDALYLLVIDMPSTIAVPSVLELWASWKKLNVSPLTSRADCGGLRYFDSPEKVEGLPRVMLRQGMISTIST